MIERRHMPVCPFCASNMRTNGPGVEIVTEFGLLALAHTHCITRETGRKPTAPPALPAAVVMQRQPERVEG